MKAFGVSQHIDRGLLKGCLFFIRVVRVVFTAVLLDRYKAHVHWFERTYCKWPMEMSCPIEKMQSCLHNISIVVLTGFA